jgi:hypothetical protein
MMPMSRSLADAPASALRKVQVEQLQMEIARLTQDNEDLRASAKIWIRLYECHLARADRAMSELAAVTDPAAEPKH